MGRRKGSDSNDGERAGESFAELLDGAVKPLPDRPGPPPGRPPRPRPRGTGAEKISFQIDRQGEEISGRAPGVSRADLKRIEAATSRGILEIDLHGLTAPEARTVVLRSLGQALKRQQRWFQVIHGRGNGSEGDAVLKRSLPGWLAEPPHGASVLGFVCSRRLPGATGVTRIWLRREGSESSGAR